MRIRTLLVPVLLFGLPLGYLACAGGDDVQDETVDVETAEAPPTMAPSQPAGGGMGGMATTVPLAAVGTSGVSGEATLTPAGSQTEVTVTLNGLEPNSTHPGHIHQGTCASPGPVVVPLSEITGDASGSGTMTATAAIATDSATAGNHLVQYHGEGGTPITCGEIVHSM